MGFFKSFFTGNTGSSDEKERKNGQKNFEIFKYDGMRARRMGRNDYAIRCFSEALAIQNDFETRNYLAQTYITTGRIEDARHELEEMIKMEPQHTGSYIALANICFMLEDYDAMAEAARQAAGLDSDNATAYYLLAKAAGRQGDATACMEGLDKAIALKDDFNEARLLRAETLAAMQQYEEAGKDIETILAREPEEENAMLLHGQIAEAGKDYGKAEASYRHVTEVNPFNEQAFVCLGHLYITQGRMAEAIEVLDEAIELNPGCAAAYRERAQARLQNGDRDGYEEDLKKEKEAAADGTNATDMADSSKQPLVHTGDILGL